MNTEINKKVRHQQSTINNPFIQILQDGCDPGEINYYNSLFKDKITDGVKKQICNLLHSKEKKVKVHVMSVQQQKNKADCGIYAIAFAYFIANSPDLSIFCLEESKLRKQF